MTDTDTDTDTDQRPTDPIDTFGIALPAAWVRIPLESGDFEDFVRGQRDRLAAEIELSRTGQRQFELIMVQLRNDCARADVRLAAALLATVDDDADHTRASSDEPHEGAGLLSASCTISVLSRASMGGELPLTVNTIAAAMAREPQPADGVEVVNLEPPEVVDLPVGRVVKLVRLHTFPPHPETRQRLAVFTEQFLFPFDEGHRVALVSFATPTPAYARPLGELFDAMMQTFRSFAGDDLTDPTA